MMTAGMKSSEFWLTIVGMGLATSLVILEADSQFVYAILGAGGAYAVSRGLAKSGGK